MELFRADLHIHSRYSRATSKSLTLRQLAAWARVKGLDVLATGDFTHPGWRKEIEESLVPDGAGLFKLADPKGLSRELPFLEGFPLSGETRFMLCTEISSIYKRGGKVRKVHNLVFMPSLEKAAAFTQRLDQVGNLESDGRPILGLDSRDLLEMVLETGDGACLIPAHVWTPWFSLFGSKSGFDSLQECFGDLSSEIFALETGLSSDPAMNWMWSELDRYQLVSNSDAHSGEKLGREANLFSGEVSYSGVFRALKGESLGDKFLGTIEFFPEEGKYHLDGHRNCKVVMDPAETRSRGGLCPVCGKPLTVGVLSRVMELADREEPVKPMGHPDFSSLIPLKELLSEIMGVGAGSKKVARRYAGLVARFGSEFALLQDAQPAEIARADRTLAEAISRMRKGQVFRQAGFDGQYGVIRAFSDKELREIRGGGALIQAAEIRKESGPDRPAAIESQGLAPFEALGTLEYNSEQKMAMEAGPHPVLVVAGPGTGKTQTLMGRIGTLMDKGVGPRRILAVTFTRRAAREMNRRLLETRGEKEALPRADTLHALAFEHWTKAYGEAPTVLDEEAARRAFGRATGLSGPELKHAWAAVSLARERMSAPEGLEQELQAYTKLKESWNLADYTDLLVFWLEQIEAEIYLNPFTQVLVDEVQDLSALQLAVVKALTPKGGEGFFAIGDPQQSIYSFRGALAEVRQELERTWPALEVIELSRNYRAAQNLLDAARHLTPQGPALVAARDVPGEIRMFTAKSAESEAAWIAERLRALIGETSHSLADAAEGGTISPGEAAVLVRFKGLVEPVRRRLDTFGLPCSAPEAEAFFREPRVAKILDAAGRFLGLTGEQDEAQGEGLSLPDRVLARGPEGMAAYLQDIPPFDRMFWKSTAFRRLSQAFKEHGGWSGLINWVHLQSELDQVRAKAERIQIMTMHAAKGLEFEAVFLPALEEGIVPFAGSGFLAGQMEAAKVEDADEERRLFYVALTRAKSMAFLSHAETRRLYGRELRLPASRFIREIPEKYYSRSKMVGKKVKQEKQLGLMQAGGEKRD